MPVYVQALNAMCRVLMKQKKYPQALAMLKRRAAIAPVNAAVYYEIARIYAHFGETENALNWLKESLEKGFDGWQVLDRDPMLENLRENPAFVKMRRQWA
jgi:tetratricopeptide (TPR) repeat protein